MAFCNEKLIPHSRRRASGTTNAWICHCGVYYLLKRPDFQTWRNTLSKNTEEISKMFKKDVVNYKNKLFYRFCITLQNFEAFVDEFYLL